MAITQTFSKLQLTNKDTSYKRPKFYYVTMLWKSNSQCLTSCSLKLHLKTIISQSHINLRLDFIEKEKMMCSQILTCDKVSFWMILSLPTLILRVDKANLSSPTSHPINLATVVKPETWNMQISIVIGYTPNTHPPSPTPPLPNRIRRKKEKSSLQQRKRNSLIRL